jgi:predicted dehydrogenase
MRVGIVGCGQIVERGHVPALLASSGVETVAVADLSASRAGVVADALAPRGRPAVYADHRAMLEREEMELVLLATPPSAHREQALEVAASGLSVLCEKPIATTLADADAIVRGCEERGVRCLMVHNYATFEEQLRICELIGQGAIGRPQTAILQGLGSDPWEGVSEFRPGWRHERGVSGGGRLMDAGVHGIYLAEMFFSRRPSRVSADVRFGSAGGPIDVRCFARYRFDDAVALLHIGEGHGGCAVEVIGEEGRLRLAYALGARFFDANPGAVELYRGGELIAAESVAARRGHMDASFYDDVLEQLDSPPAYAHSARHGRDLLATMTATYFSAWGGRDFDLDDPLPRHVYANGAMALWA